MASKIEEWEQRQAADHAAGKQLQSEYDELGTLARERMGGGSCRYYDGGFDIHGAADGKKGIRLPSAEALRVAEFIIGLCVDCPEVYKTDLRAGAIAVLACREISEIMDRINGMAARAPVLTAEETQAITAAAFRGGGQ